MAETISPPLFREPLVERGPLTMSANWQRWLNAFWQQAASGTPGPAGPTGPQGPQGPTGPPGPALGTGAAMKVGVWQDSATMSYDTLLHYDSATDRLGIGTATPGASLHVLGPNANSNVIAEGFLAPDYRPGTDNRVGFYSHVTAGVNCWGVLHAGTAASSFGGTLAVSGATVLGSTLHVGGGISQGTAPVAGYSFYGLYAGYFGGNVQVSGHTGLPYDPPVNVWVRSGSLAADNLYLGTGDVAARYQLDAPGGWAHIANLGVGALPDGAHPLIVGPGKTVFQVGALVGIRVEPRWPLDCSGQGHVTQLGVWYGPDNAATAGVDLRVRWAQMDCLSLLGGLDTRFAARFYSHIYCDGNPYCVTPGPWMAFSDARLKHVHGEIERPLETMCALHGVRYEYTDTRDGKPPGVRMGVLAQEVEAVIPEWVGELSGYKTTQLSAFEALTIEAMKELTARVAALEGA